MEENKETQEATDPEGTGPEISKEIGDFNFLIGTLIEYYQAKSGMRNDEEGEGWKKNTKYEQIDLSIPKRIDDAVERAFLAQLKKFSDPSSKTNAQ